MPLLGEASVQRLARHCMGESEAEKLVLERKDLVRGTLLLKFTERDRWSVSDAVEGLQVFGSTGSGKTSGSGAAIAHALLAKREHFPGFGGLVLTAKKDEFGTWQSYLRKTGRSGDLVELKPGARNRFNFLSHEFNRPRDKGGQLTQNVVSILVSALSTGGATASRSDPYWEEALRELLTHAVDLLVLAKRDEEGYAPINLATLFHIVRSAPQSPSEAQSRTWRASSVCARYLFEAEARRSTYPVSTDPDFLAGRQSDLDETQRFWLVDFPRLTDRVRSIVVSSFTAKVSGLLRSPMRELFCAEENSEHLAPERSFEGKIIILNIPVKTFGEVGRMAQVLYKSVWQKAVERRAFTGQWCPVFLWADEAQFFVTKDDPLYQGTARSQFAATVYLTQNLPTYHAALDTQGSTAATAALLGNLQTKIFHANGDPATNEWAERVFGKVLIPDAAPTGDKVIHTPRRPTQSAPVIEARAFTLLRKGNVSPLIDAFVFQSGRPWARPGARGDSDPRNFGRVCFDRALHQVHIDKTEDS